jgi:hypothetical protein
VWERYESNISQTAASAAAREKLHWQLKSATPALDPEQGKPSKRDRRELDRFRKR